MRIAAVIVTFLGALLGVGVWLTLPAEDRSGWRDHRQGWRDVPAQPREGYPRTWVWRSPTVAVPGGFTELLPSWNADTPPGAGLRVAGRVRSGGGWSPWLDFGYWGEAPPPREAHAFDGGQVLVDVLELDSQASAYELRATLYQHDPAGGPPTLRRVHAVASAPAPARPTTASDWAGDLGVPFLPQGNAHPLVRSQVCSPTGVTMAMRHHGVEADHAEVIRAVYDREHGLFGNWNRAVAAAGAAGLDARVERFRDWPAVGEALAGGAVVVMSVNFEAGACPSFAMDGTAGHLIVVRGLTAEGDVIANDPADRAGGEGIVLAREEVEHAWFGNAGGVAYVIEAP